MARKVSRSSADEIEATEGDQGHSGEAEESSTTPKKSITKAGAARVALAEGILAPKEASHYILQKFGITISPQQFSAEKSRFKHRSGDSHTVGQFTSSSYLPGVASRSPIGEADLLQALEAMKPLIDQLGVEKVKRMVDLLG